MNKIFCLETEWDQSMHDLKKKSTVLPLLDFLENAINIEYTFRQVATESDFNYYIDHLQQPSYKAYDLIYLCFHGQKKCICFADKTDLALMAFAEKEERYQDVQAVDKSKNDNGIYQRCRFNIKFHF